MGKWAMVKEVVPHPWGVPGVSFLSCTLGVGNLMTLLLLSAPCAQSRSPARLLSPWDSPGKNTGEGCHFLLQGIYLSRGSNLHLLHWQADTLPLYKLHF